ncbi:MAG TPA: hypothetical protein VJP76_06240 [Candidatus Tumulicola sp.]|nr:hypothetical protein [Candidatus Tumulicola sp.]
MPFLAVTHLRPARCPDCGSLLAQAGARSFLVDGGGVPRSFNEADPPAELRVRLACPNGHALELLIPNDVAAEEVSAIPDGAPIGADAVVVSGTAESGHAL